MPFVVAVPPEVVKTRKKNLMNVSLSFTIDQLNIIMNALGQRPFVEVADLIAKIKVEAEQQLSAQTPPAPEMTED